MSHNDLISREQALFIAKKFIYGEGIALRCKNLCIGGSIRRRKPYVHDIEIIAIPHYTLDFLAYLDRLIVAGIISKALYGKDRTPRWGTKYRGLHYMKLPEARHVKIEIFLADEHNWGYHQWLRTGPGNANTYIMSKLKWDNSPLRFRSGNAIYQGEKLLHIPTEDDLFQLLKMPTIAPEHRAESLYKLQLREISYSTIDISHLHWEPIPSEPNQQKLL